MPNNDAGSEIDRGSRPLPIRYTLQLVRMQMIETAEDASVWISHVRKQWGGGPVVSLRVMLGTEVVGLTPPTALNFAHAWSSQSPSTPAPPSSSTRPRDELQNFSGINWSRSGVSFDLARFSKDNAVMVLEMLNFTTIPPTCSGMAVVNAQSFVAHASAPGVLSAKRPSFTQRYAVHCFPSSSSQDGDKDTTTHAVLVVDLNARASGEAAPVPASSTSVVSADSSVPVSQNNSFVSAGDGLGSGPPLAIAPELGLTMAASNRSFTDASAMLTGRAGSVPSPQPQLQSEHPNASRAPLSSMQPSPSHPMLSPLDYNFGPVRLSTRKLFFPTSFLNTTGDYIVSNVVCAMNNTEDTLLTMQLVVSNRGGDRRNSAIDAPSLIVTHPREPVTVRPQQRAFFSATWGVGKGPLGFHALQESVVVQLVVLGSKVPFPPIELEPRCSHPQHDRQQDPFHYWVNTTMLTNRALSEELELPYVRSVLPVFLLLHHASTFIGQLLTTGNGTGNNSGNSSNRSTLGTTSRSSLAKDAPLVLRDKDHGGLVVLSSSPIAPIVVEHALAAAIGGSSGAGGITSRAPVHIKPLLPWQQRLRRATELSDSLLNPFVDASGPLRIVLHLGAVRGLPMVFSAPAGNATRGAGQAHARSTSEEVSSLKSPSTSAEPGGATSSDSGVESTAPAFRISLAALHPGWKVVRGETNPAYQTQSGGLSWIGETLEVVKAAGAQTLQCLRLDLSEVNMVDDYDEIPIGCALLTIGSGAHVRSVSNLLVAFYVYDSYSQYDKLSTSSLVMREAGVEVEVEPLAETIAT